jgi:hypothetical protein
MGRCVRPLHGFRSSGGRVSFSRNGAYVDMPVTVSCGQCIECRLERSRQWAVRIMHEASLHDENCFITLTYSDEHLPPNSSLRIQDFQKFAKRVRKGLGPFRYFQCGEYGEVNSRPHFHVCMFGHQFSHDRIHHSRTHDGNPLFTSPSLTRFWGQGHALIGNLTFESAAYVARYVTKKVTGKDAQEHYDEVNPLTGEVTSRRPEFCSMSRRPGIGHKWIKKYHADVYPRDEVIVRGKRARPPKYYDQVVELDDPAVMARVKRERSESRERFEERHPEELTWERNETREQVRLLTAESWKREPGSK